jgi:hypothetical protein
MAMPTSTLQPVALGPDFSAGLQALVRAAAQNSQPGSSALRTAMDDPAVHTLVLALRFLLIQSAWKASLAILYFLQ